MSKGRVQPIQIYMLLPKRNCGRCGVTTCLAFAAKLANGEATPDLCPFLTSQAKAQISALTMPPVRVVSISSSSVTLEVGGEEGLFRHDGGFRREARVAYPIYLSSSYREMIDIVSSIESIVLDRIGSKLSVDLYLVDLRRLDLDLIGDGLNTLRRVTDKPLILRADNLKVYLSALRFLEDEKPAIMIDPSIIPLERLIDERSIRDYPIVVLTKDISVMDHALAKIEDMGIGKIIIGIHCSDIKKFIEYTSSIRMKAIEGDRRFGYPILADICEAVKPYDDIIISATAILRYASIIVLPRSITREGVEGLLVLKQSVYMDPRKPKMVNPGIYEVGVASRSSPVIVTSNYALTFYIVRKAIEASSIGCWILAIDTGGLSVASAIGGGRFTARQVVEAIQAYSDRVDIRSVPIILPGLASHIKPEIESGGFNVLVGPVKAKDLPSFIKSLEYG